MNICRRPLMAASADLSTVPRLLQASESESHCLSRWESRLMLWHPLQAPVSCGKMRGLKTEVSLTHKECLEAYVWFQPRVMGGERPQSASGPVDLKCMSVCIYAENPDENLCRARGKRGKGRRKVFYYLAVGRLGLFRFLNSSHWTLLLI